MLYKKNLQPHLSEELFKNPTSEYRGTPFWAWNCKLDSTEMLRQIDVFKKMGLGGFHIHVRTGLETEYLGKDYMQVVRDCVAKAKNDKMLAWLYDEDRWPSGAAGGIVTADRQYRERQLVFAPWLAVNENTGLLACYDIQLTADGLLDSYRRIGKDDPAAGTKWYAQCVIASSDSWYNGQTYIDTLNKKAVERFIEVTHESYKREIGEEFGETVPAIFCDEPQFARKRRLGNSMSAERAVFPWTDDLPETYLDAYGKDIFDTLPELVWERSDGTVSQARYFFHDHTTERFAEAYADTIGKWCEENGISLTGHMMEEPTLTSQTDAVGEAMRSYRGFQIPGIDMLCARFELTTAKQAQSAVHQYDREAMMSELYGVTGWDYDFRGYKLHGDWQATLGVTVRVPHLSWASMAGAAKRDYPASIHYQSPWYEQYPVVEDHFGRVNAAMTRGKPIVKVGVIHPIESFWLHCGPNDKTALEREAMNQQFADVTDWLLTGSVDFDFISEALLPSLCRAGTCPLKVGAMEYDAIVVPGCETLRSTTLERLEDFRRAGGHLVFMGDAPKYENAVSSDRGKALFAESEVITFGRADLLSALDCERTLTIRYADGRLANKYIYQLRKDTDCKWLFVSHCVEPYNKDLCGCDKLSITVKGELTPQLCNTLTGEISTCSCDYIDGNTVIAYEMYDYDSLLLRLDEGKAEQVPAVRNEPVYSLLNIDDEVNYTLSEPNVLLLDMAETSVDGAEFLPREELLRADNIWRKRLGMVNRGGRCVQPWALPGEAPTSKITLRFSFMSEITYSGALLALEDAEKTSIVFNGQVVDNTVTGYYTDKAIKTVKLPDIITGSNLLEITVPFGVRTNTEWCYILGTFGVRAAGRRAVITKLPEKLAFSSVVSQGLPFYGGNITYHINVNTADGKLRVALTRFRAAMLRAYLDGKDLGAIAYTPYAVSTEVSAGEHRLDLELFGNRFNCFGAVHNSNTLDSWHGPGAWATSGAAWSYEYVLRDLGALIAPVVELSTATSN